MKICYLDSNVLIYFKDEDSDFHERTKNLIEDLLKEGFTLTVSPLVLDEFLHSLNWVLGQKRLSRKNRFELLRSGLGDILDLPDLRIVGPPLYLGAQRKVPLLMEQYNLRPRDAYHFLTMKSEEISFFATFDNDFEDVFEQGLLTSALWGGQRYQRLSLWEPPFPQQKNLPTYKPDGFVISE